MEHLYRASIMEEVRALPIKKTPDETYSHKIITSPIGPLTLVANEEALVCLTWGVDTASLPYGLGAKTAARRNPILRRTDDQLREYFAGERRVFDIPLEPKGTDFQQQVWQQLLKIPYGQYITYGEQARRMNRPTATRAVGAANGKNPIGIIIPCHRVIGASGHLTGFAGGLEIKRQLLELEGLNNFMAH